MKRFAALVAAVALAGFGGATQTTTHTQGSSPKPSGWSGAQRSWFVDGCAFGGASSDFCNCALGYTVQTYPNPKQAVSGIKGNMHDALEAFGVYVAANTDKFPNCTP